MAPAVDPIESILAAAVEITSEAERRAYVDRACASDAALKRRVEELIDNHFRAGSFLETPVLDPGATTDQPVRERPGTIIGPYKLLETIGEGGFGVVYMAEQQEPVRRKVALKVLKPGMETAHVVARFEAERQALALMDHPNIAKVHGAGTTPDGRPYFVMELVRGVPITNYCDDHRRTPRQRLELFIGVCQAVQHAHQKGVIHRDLKPSNVLVALYDDKPVPKVIDFGVAKAMGQKLTEATLHTGFGAVVGTVEYMSPEQAGFNQLDVDTRSDVYSLGVLLYELMTGTTPLDRKRARENGLLEALRIVREEEVPTLSNRLSSTDELPAIATNRGLEPARLTRLVRGELDWIVMKALEKDRNRRYETANGFAADVQRYLADEPVQACPPSAAYRIRKFARRNKRALITLTFVAVMLLTLVGVAAGSFAWVARDRAARQADIEREVNGLLDQTALLRDQGKWPEARAVLERAEHQAEQGSPDLRQRVRQSATDLDVARNLEEIGLWRIRSESDFRVWTKARQTYTEVFRKYGIDLTGLDPAAAAELIRTSAINEHLLTALDDWDWNHHLSAGYAGAFLILASKEERAKRKQEQEKPITEGRDVSPERLREVASLADSDEWRKRVRAWPAGKEYSAGLDGLAATPDAALPPATALLLGRAFYKVKALPKTIEILTKAQQHHPADLRLICELVWALRIGKSDATRREQRASFLRAALALRPKSPGLHFQFTNYWMEAGNLDQAIAELRTVVKLDPGHADAHFRLGFILARHRSPREAIPHLDRAIELGKEGPLDVYAERGRAYMRIGQWPQSAADYEEAGKQHFPGPELGCELASVFLLADKPESYRRLAAQAVVQARTGSLRDINAKPNENARRYYLGARMAVLAPGAVPDLNPVLQLAERAVAARADAPEFLHTLGMAHLRAGHPDKAVQRLQESSAVKPEWNANVVNWLGLALACHQSGRPNEAREWLDKAVQWIDREAPKTKDSGLAAIGDLQPHDWLACRVLRREAETLLKSDQT
ncbi:MAG TPA: protein kinase, partial [Gemmataceae bacterium]|nr:protein kinase [Gemmataceae bacterium]